MPPPRRLFEYPWVIVNVACALCPRRGRYRLARLAERHGADALLDDVLRAIAGGCTWWNERPRKYEVRCGARFEDLMLRPPPDDPPPEPPRPHGPPPAVTGVVLRRHGPPREALPGSPGDRTGRRGPAGVIGNAPSNGAARRGPKVMAGTGFRSPWSVQ